MAISRAFSQILRLVFCILLVSCAPRAGGEDITVEDILDGIEARRSEINDASLDYDWKIERTDYFFEREDRLRQQQVDAGAPAERLAPKSDTIARSQSGHYRLRWRGERIAYDVLSTELDSNVLQRGSFDGELFTGLNAQNSRGLVARRAPERVIGFRQVSDLLEVGGHDLSQLLKEDNVRAEVVGVSLEDGDTVVELVIQRPLPGPAATVKGTRWPDIVGAYNVAINTTKKFWPARIRCTRDYLDRDNGNQLASILERTSVTEAFAESGGVYYPARVVETVYGSESAPRKKGEVLRTITRTDVVSKEVIEMRSVALNTDLADSDLEFDFPPGTRYSDEVNGVGYVVNADGAIEKLAEQMRDGPRLLASEFTEEQATKAFAEYNKDRSVNDSWPRLRWVLYALAAAFVLAIFVLTRRRRTRGVQGT